MKRKKLSLIAVIVCSGLAVAMLFLSPDLLQVALRTSDGFAFASHGGERIPETFTIRYDTAEGIEFMVHALGRDYIRVTSPTALEAGKECDWY